MTTDHISDDQTETIAFLSSPAAYGVKTVERMDTHASILFLAGDRAWKLKRAVRYDYLDYSTPERRRAMCEAELAINRPLAPDIYRRVVPVTRDERGQFAIDGSGPAADWLVEMARFNQEDLFDRLAAAGSLEPSAMPALAATIAHVHEMAERRPDRGGHAGLAWVIEGNATGLASEPMLAEDSNVCARITAKSRTMNNGLQRHLDKRREQGFVRRGHGDLHLGNIVRFQGRPTLFDAVEFNDAVGCVDVMYDLAFVLMDLWRLSLRSHANTLLNAYLGETLDFGGLAPLQLFLACRAAIRAKTSATAAHLQLEPGRRADLIRHARAYLSLADQLLTPPPACLVAIGGLSGSGKSSVALALAPDVGPVPGAVVVRSDEVRKRLFGVAPMTRLGPESYTPAISARVYRTIASQADAVLAGAHAALVDATFLGSTDRRAVEDVARAAGVAFIGLWLEASEGERLDRIRRRVDDPSDADAHVILQQTVEGAITWHRIDASGPVDRVMNDARRLVAEAVGSSRL